MANLFHNTNQFDIGHWALGVGHFLYLIPYTSNQCPMSNVLLPISKANTPSTLDIRRWTFIRFQQTKNDTRQFSASPKNSFVPKSGIPKHCGLMSEFVCPDVRPPTLSPYKPS